MSVRANLGGLALGLSAGLASGVAAASPTDTFGFGARGPSLGNAMVASDDALSSPVYNAAAGALGEELQLGLGYSRAWLDLAIDDRDLDLMDARGAFGALTVPFDLGSVALAVSTAVYIPDQFVARLSTLPPTRPQLVLWDNRPHRITYDTALSARFARRVAVGVGVSGLGDAEGDVGLTLGSKPGRTVSDADIDASLPTRTAPILGVLATPTDDLRLGARYHEEIAIHVKLDVAAETNVEGTSLSGTTLVRTEGLGYFTPREVAAGGAWDLDAWTFAAEVGWKQWSRIESVAFAVEVDVDIGVDAPVYTFESPDPGWRDTWNPRVGVERRFALSSERELAARVGYAWVPSPVPEQPGLTSYGDASRHVVGLGAGLSLPDLGSPVEIELATGMQQLEHRTFRKRDVLQPSGGFSVSGRVFTASLGLRVTP